MMVGLGRFELPTPRLSSVCSNQLSYRPTKAPLVQRARLRRHPSPGKPRSPPVEAHPREDWFSQNWIERKQQQLAAEPFHPCLAARANRSAEAPDRSKNLPEGQNLAVSSCGSSRKEVIQPQVLLQLPCYDFTPITDHTLSACPPCGLA